MKAISRGKVISLLFLLLNFLTCGYLDINYYIYGTSPAQSGIVSAFDFSNGQKGKLLFKTDLENNNFKLVINPKSAFILIELENFSFFDSINSKKISADENIHWECVIVEPKPDEHYNINPITTIASALTKYKITSLNPSNPQDLKNIIVNSHETIARHFGELDVVKTIPSSLDILSNSLSNELKYGLFLASFVEISHYHSEDYKDFNANPFNILNLTKSIYEDIIFDGFLDGIAEYGATVLSLNGVTDRILKSDLALSLYRVIQNPSLNRTGLTLNETLPFINGVSTSKVEIFKRDSPTYPFDAQGPLIQCSKPQNGETFQGNIGISCIVEDKAPGVEETVVKLNDFCVNNSLSFPEFFYAVVDSKPISAGSATIEVTAKDKIGNFSSQTINIIIDKP